MPNGSNKIWRKRSIHRRPQLVMVENWTNSLLGPLPHNENRSFIPHIIGKAMVAQTLIGPIYLPTMHERKVEW